MAHTNALAKEKSPYLRQHADNPVDWLPWGDAAFKKSREEDKPIFLSIGYSTCHWCHVMAHESFEDPAIAEILNQHFVPVKLDREERPDIDRVYMLFVQASTGSGGWPMSVWLTPDLQPFYGGTYFPPDNRYGRPGFRTILQNLAAAWRDDHARILESGVNVTEQLRSVASGARDKTPVTQDLIESAYWQFRRSYDAVFGGFGTAPKFPRPSTLLYLLRYYVTAKNDEAVEMVVNTLRKMAVGGMHDQLGGGFHRYSVDERWFVPHFEKMLYDQAQLAIAYLEAFQATGDGHLSAVVHDILGYVERDLTSPEGGFYSAEDADSADPEDPAKHGEGAFYIWRQAEIERLLGADAREFCEAFGVLPEGNVQLDPHGEFGGRNILHQAIERADLPALQSSKQKLFEAREKRPRPHLDSKILTGWNGLMISAFARSAAVFDRQDYLQKAERAAVLLLTHAYNADSGKLFRRFCESEASIDAFADDYAFFAQGLLDLFGATGDYRYFEVAEDLCRRGLAAFRDENEGGYFSTAADAPHVLLRLKDDYDGAEPSANSVAADVLLRLAHFTGQSEFQLNGERTLDWLSSRMQSQPTVAPQGLCAAMRWLTGSGQVLIRCESTDAKAREIAAEYLQTFRPFIPVILLPDNTTALLSGRAEFVASLTRKARFTIYECRDFVCQLPRVIS